MKNRVVYFVAAAAANVLEWTRWGKVAGLTGADEMFACYRDHFTPDFGGASLADCHLAMQPAKTLRK